MSYCYDNYTIVERHRSWGRGIHGLYDERKRNRRHVRRFLNWYIGKCESSRRIKMLDDRTMLIPGRIFSGGRWTPFGTNIECWLVYEKGLYSDIPDEFCFKEAVRASDMLIIDYHRYHYFGFRFERDGVPNSYGDYAREFDKLSENENRKAFHIKQNSNEWKKKFREEIVDIAKRHYEKSKCIEKIKDIPRDFVRTYKYMYPYLYKNEYSDFCSYVVSRYHSIIQEEMQRECNRSKSSASQSMRQLRALGFVA